MRECENKKTFVNNTLLLPYTIQTLKPRIAGFSTFPHLHKVVLIARINIDNQQLFKYLQMAKFH